ncbi:MAG: phosphoribosylglycinamide formyltransferase [Candidatus Micrarchaeota archaeon]|nr:phosphoribosylglycinamide formyltransferase [Candidatus Micrarchaeota archaeon]
MAKISIAVLASGRGSNFQAIIDGIKNGEVNCEIKILITDNPDAKAIERAKKSGIKYEVVERSKFKTREEMDLKIKQILDSNNVELVVLAGYMRLLKAKELFDVYRNRIINIHPSLLPKYPGVDAQKQAFEAGEKISGLTIHFVNEELDAGPIIYQEKVDISNCKSIGEVSEKILKREHEAYRKVVNSFSKGKYVIKDKKATFVIY